MTTLQNVDPHETNEEAKMKNAKRILAMLLVLCMMAAMCACTTTTKPTEQNTEKPTDAPKPTDGDATEAPTEDNGEIPLEKTVALILQPGGLGDEGWNDASWAGLQRMMKERGIGGVTVETAATADTEFFIRELAEKGYGLIYCLDTSVIPTCMQVSADYPDSMFVYPAKLNLNANKGNTYWMWYQLNEIGFMAGVVAAFVATDGNEIVDYAGQNPGCKIGCIFGADSAGFYRYADGFEHGAKWVNPDAEVVYDFTAGYTDTANCQTIAENMIKNNGCDVIWTCCGTAGYGGLQACRLNGALGIGVDSDQDMVEEGYVITSGMRMMDHDIEFVIDKWLAGTLEGSNDMFDLANGSVGITDMSVIEKHVTNKENFQRLKDKVTEVEQLIKERKLRPYDTAETAYTGDGTIVRFADWWKENKDTNPNNIHDWYYPDQIIYN